jgi:hypothetical protein
MGVRSSRLYFQQKRLDADVRPQSIRYVGLRDPNIPLIPDT